MRQRVVDHHLMVGGLRCADLAERFGTPLYVTDEDVIVQNYRRIRDAFNGHLETRVHYACKANSNLAVLRILEREGASIDAVSAGEVFLCLKAGFQPGRIMFTGTSVRTDELEWLVGKGVEVNLDSTSAIERLAGFYKGRVALRMNPEVGAGHHEHVITGVKDSKFGIPQAQAVDAVVRAKKLGLEVVGLHIHIGSGILTKGPFMLAAGKIIEIAQEVEEGAGVRLEWIDIGSGFGTPYRPGEGAMDIEAVAGEICSLFKRRLPGKTLRIEPGRSIVADSTVLLTRANTVKRTDVKNYVGVDAGFNLLIRPAFYGSYHHVVIADRADAPATVKYDIAGPLCESGDLLARDRELPEVSEGDLLAVLDAGAYGFSMASRYNSRPLCAEVLVKGRRAHVIRERESFEDLLKGQRIPGHLKGRARR